MRKYYLIASLAALVGIALPAHAQLTAITTTDSGGLRNLSTLTANGTTYNVSSLIGISVNHYYHTQTAIFNNAYAPTQPATGSRLSLLTGDDALNTGFANIGVGTGLTTTFASTTPGINVVFNSAVVNRPGIDVVLFEVDDANGNPFWVSLSDGSARTQIATPSYAINTANVSTRNWDMDRGGAPMNGGATSVTEFQTNGITVQNTFTQDIRGVGIDLSDLGIANGASVSSLFFQATTGPTGGVDPSLIRGLPTVVPEAGSIALLFCGLLPVGAVALRSRKRR